MSKNSILRDFFPLFFVLGFMVLYLLLMCGIFAINERGKYISEAEAIKYEQDCRNIGGEPWRTYGDYNDEIGKIRWVSCR